MNAVIILGKTENWIESAIRVDDKTRALVLIDTIHHEIHEGELFYSDNSDVLANGGVVNYLLTTPDSDKAIHLAYVVDGTAVTQIDLYEATDKAGVASVNVFNANRLSSNPPTMTIKKGLNGGTTYGTLIKTHKSGSATGASSRTSASIRAGEVILKKNTKYILRVTSGTADNLTNTKFEWYEHARLED